MSINFSYDWRNLVQIFTYHISPAKTLKKRCSKLANQLQSLYYCSIINSHGSLRNWVFRCAKLWCFNRAINIASKMFVFRMFFLQCCDCIFLTKVTLISNLVLLKIGVFIETVILFSFWNNFSFVDVHASSSMTHDIAYWHKSMEINCPTTEIKGRSSRCFLWIGFASRTLVQNFSTIAYQRRKRRRNCPVTGSIIGAVTGVSWKNSGNYRLLMEKITDVTGLS